MRKFSKNIILFIVVLIISYITAPYFGYLYDKFSPQYDGSFLGLSKSFAVFFAGLPVAYVFFIPFIFELLGSGSKKKWILWLLLPPSLLWLLADLYYIYIPIIIAFAGFFLAKLILLAVFKLKRSNLSQIVK